MAVIICLWPRYIVIMPTIQESYAPLFNSRANLVYQCGHLCGISYVLTFCICASPANIHVTTNIPFGQIADMAFTLGFDTKIIGNQLEIIQSNVSIRPISDHALVCDLLIVDDAQNYHLDQLQDIIGHAGNARTIIAHHPYKGDNQTNMWLDSLPHTRVTWRSNLDNLSPAMLAVISNSDNQAQWEGEAAASDGLTALFPHAKGGK